MPKHDRKRLRRRLRYPVEILAMRATAAVIPRLPRSWVLKLARAIAGLAYRFDRRSRKTTLANLEAVFGDRFSLAERDRIARQSFENLGISVFDLMWARNLSDDNLDRYVSYEILDPDSYHPALENGALWLTAHFGNFEWLALVEGFRGYNAYIVAEDFKNPALTPLYRSLREASGHTLIPQERAMIRLLKHLKRGGHAAFLTDLTVPPSKHATIIECFGMKTCVTILHGLLVQRLDVPVIPCVCLPQPDDTYLMRYYPPLEIRKDSTPQEIAQVCWDVFEKEIRARPEHWIWMYKHWRHLPEETAPGYPRYARYSKKFAKLVSAQSH